MKKLILISIFITAALAVFPQCEYEVNEIDEFTGDVNIITKAIPVAKGDNFTFLYSRLCRIDDVSALSLNFTGDIGCVTSETYIILKFENGETIKLEHMGGISCKKGANMFYGLSPATIELLKNNPIYKIRISASRRIVDIEFLNHDYFINTLPCLE